jgi:trimethylamine--corrinoid protein Co-methyltransferase
MNSKGLSGGQYRPLSRNEIAVVHEAALTVLDQIGITFEEGLEETVEMLANAGARVDRRRARVTFPPGMIDAQCRRAPRRVVLCGRQKGHDLDLTEHRVHLGTGGAAIKVIDPETGQARSSTLEDLYRLGRLVDALEHIHFFLRPCIPTDIPERAYDENVFYACLRSTAKHVMAGVNDEGGFDKVFKLASMVAGSPERLQARPFISIITSFAISPLKLCTQSTRIMQSAVGRQIPVALSSAPMAGSTAPITMAGTLVQLHAEQLAGIAICQLTRPGAPLLYGGIPGMANLNTMGYLGGGVECGMMNAAIHQLAHHVGVPNYNSAGLSDSKLPDAQAGWEKALTILLATMGGSNYVHHAAGMLESMLTVAYEQFVIDNEIIGMCCQVLRGIETDPEHLALEVIRSIGPGGNYMTAPHTMSHMRSEYFNASKVTDRRSRDRWSADGARDARERARLMALEILDAPATSYLPEEIERRLRETFDIRLS